MLIMDNIGWKLSSTSPNKVGNHQTIYLLKSFSENPYGRFEPEPMATTPTKTWSSSAPPPSSSSSSSRSSNNNGMQGFLRKLRKKFRKEKKVYGSDLVIVPYNSYTYAKNFEDRDMVLAEPDNLSRTFSYRFAASPGMLRRAQSVR